MVFKRVGDDLYFYNRDHVTIVEDYYKKRRKKKRKKKKKEKVKKSHINKIVYTICLIEIIVAAYIITTPFTKFTSNKIEFNFGAEKNEFRAGYSIDFSWEISNQPSQAFITWGDGTTLDLKDKIKYKNILLAGTPTHTYALQGKYSPTLSIFDIYDHQYSKFL